MPVFDRWEPIQDDGGADVKHYIVEYFRCQPCIIHNATLLRDVWDVWLKAKTTKDCQVTIEDLIPGSRCASRPLPTYIHFVVGTNSGLRQRTLTASVTRVRSATRSTCTSMYREESSSSLWTPGTGCPNLFYMDPW